MKEIIYAENIEDNEIFYKQTKQTEERSDVISRGI